MPPAPHSPARPRAPPSPARPAARPPPPALSGAEALRGWRRGRERTPGPGESPPGVVRAGGAGRGPGRQQPEHPARCPSPCAQDGCGRRGPRGRRVLSGHGCRRAITMCFHPSSPRCPRRLSGPCWGRKPKPTEPGLAKANPGIAKTSPAPPGAPRPGTR